MSPWGPAVDLFCAGGWSSMGSIWGQIAQLFYCIAALGPGTTSTSGEPNSGNIFSVPVSAVSLPRANHMSSVLKSHLADIVGLDEELPLSVLPGRVFY